MTHDALRRALASGNAQVARRTIAACGESLRQGDAEQPEALVAELVALATHTSPVLRQAAADVCDAFPDAAFDEVHARLLGDDDVFVRNAAEAAGHRHARGLRRRTKERAEERLVAEALRALEDQYDPAARRLAERAVERGIEAFAAHLAHEVGKAEAGILRALFALEKGLERPERGRLLAHDQIALVRERAQFAFAMVRRARDYAERAKPVFKEQPLGAIVDEARAQLLDRLGPRASRLAVTSDVDAGLRIQVDRYHLLQALQNVLQNAAEAYDEGAERLTVRVSASMQRGGSEAVIVVTDEGVGIPDENRETLFVPFGSRKAGGTGLGLLIVRRAIVDVHGGRLAIDPAPGKGTQVTMTLPASQERR